MALQLDITTIGGESFAVTGFDSWLVRDLKLAIERDRKFTNTRQRLFTNAGEELHDEKPLNQFCSAGMAPQTLMLVKVSKSQPEIDLFERWLENTPAWLQSATESVMDNRDFSELRHHPDYFEIGHNNWGVRGGAFRPDLGRNSSELVRSNPACVPEVATEEAQVLTTGRDVISAVETSIRYFGGEKFMISHAKADLAFLRHKSLLAVIVQAEMQAVVSAIVMEPFLMIPHTEDSIILSAMRLHCGLSSIMRDRLRKDRWFFYEALECDAELREDFLGTAGKTEINAWLWDQEEVHGRDFKNHWVVRAEPAEPVEAGKREKHRRGGSREPKAKRPTKLSRRRWNESSILR